MIILDRSLVEKWLLNKDKFINAYCVLHHITPDTYSESRWFELWCGYAENTPPKMEE